MNCEPNTTHWPIGALVLHDADAKERRMLMRVVAYYSDGRCVTQYANLENAYVRMTGQTIAKRYVNGIEFLHDPARFGISKEAVNGQA